MIRCTETFPKVVMVSGYFDPFHYAHLDFIKQASKLGDKLICVVGSDKQAMMKKGRVNEPQNERAEILDLILIGLNIPHTVYINFWDKETTLIAEALAILKPDVFCRGSDKKFEDMPISEKAICKRLDISIIHINGKIAHGAQFR